jgi:hypothetical protein
MACRVPQGDGQFSEADQRIQAKTAFPPRRNRTLDGLPPTLYAGCKNRIGNATCEAAQYRNGSVAVKGCERSPEGRGVMTSQEREILAFVKLNQPVARGTIQECFPQWNTGSILAQLESAGLVSCELRPTAHGQQHFYNTKNASQVGSD